MYHKDNPKPRKIQARTIRSLIRARYGSISAFCRSTGFSRPAVYAVIRGANRSDERALQIANAIGKNPHECWPQWFPAPPATETAA